MIAYDGTAGASAALDDLARAGLPSKAEAVVVTVADPSVGARVSLRELVNGLNALGITPQDLIAVLQAVKTAGALDADLEIM